ncbi:RecF/RecN/SMC N domain protein [Pseudomonas syringae pv. maculicola]|nr:RecF/RecN/SMC N domain protein [Pseudomonas syringae pv. maculicola]
MTHAHHRSLALQVKNKVMNALLNSGFIVATEVDEIDAQGR